MHPAAIAARPTYTGAKALFASRVGILTAGVLLVVAAWRGYPALGLVSVGLVATGLVIRLWSVAALRGLGLERRLARGAVFAGGEAVYGLKVTNAKALPLPWVEVACSLPPSLVPQGLTVPQGAPRAWQLSQVSLLWYETAEISLRLPCRRRGIYRLGPAVVSSGDLFGLVVRAREDSQTHRLVVYPRVYALERLGLPSRFPMGESRVATPLFEDPARHVGIKDHAPGMPLKRVHWKATARRGGRLMVKVFEPTTTLRVGIVVDVEGLAPEAAEGEPPLELALSAAASLAAHLIESGQAAGVFVNSAGEGSRGPLALGPGSGSAHLTGILEGLAGVGPSPVLAGAELWDRGIREMFPGDTLVLVGAAASPALAARVLAARRAGHPVVMLAVGPEARAIPGVPLWRVASPRDLRAGMGARP